MGYQKLQVGRITAMDDKKSDFSDTVNLNDPILDASGNPKTYAITAFAFDGTSSTITASGATFITDGVQVGDVAYNVTTILGAGRISQVSSETEIVVEGIVGNIGQSFSVLTGSTETAVLYIGTHPAAGAKQIKVRTSGGDDIIFENIPEGSFLPVQVKRIFLASTTVTDVLALF
tara:strand:+ start:5885 stop:6409 length:525 start_codon:yes stop_codon:yes gene_type:complete